MERLEAEIAECVSEAASDLRPAGVGFGRVELDLNVNRREVGRMLDVNDLNAPAGLTDREAGMIFIRQEGRSNPSVIVNYAAHPLTMGGLPREFYRRTIRGRWRSFWRRNSGRRCSCRGAPGT